MEINRFDIASIKRIADCVAVNRRKLAKAEEKLAKLTEVVNDLTSQIESFEAPIRKKWGYSSEELIRANFNLDVLNGTSNSTCSETENREVEVSEVSEETVQPDTEDNEDNENVSTDEE